MSERHGIIYETFIKEDITCRRYQYDDVIMEAEWAMALMQMQIK